jgi:hypothetical protein
MHATRNRPVYSYSSKQCDASGRVWIHRVIDYDERAVKAHRDIQLRLCSLETDASKRRFLPFDITPVKWGTAIVPAQDMLSSISIGGERLYADEDDAMPGGTAAEPPLLGATFEARRARGASKRARAAVGKRPSKWTEL